MVGRYGCVLCDEKPPHSHDLGVILNSLYFCPDGERHIFRPRRWRQRRRRCQRCGEKVRYSQYQISIGSQTTARIRDA